MGYNGIYAGITNCYSTGLISSSSSSVFLSSSGGIAGCVRNSSYIKNCVALNPNVKCVGSNKSFGRVFGYLYDSNSSANNNAFNNMLNPDGGTTWNNKGADNLDGEDISIQSINADGTLGGIFTSANGWTTQNGKLPGLFGNTVDIPEYLNTNTGVTDVVKTSGLIIYPNPTNNHFFIECENCNSIKIYDMLGKEILTHNVNGKTEVNISHLSKGVYNVSILSEGIIIGNSKIMKQ